MDLNDVKDARKNCRLMGAEIDWLITEVERLTAALEAAKVGIGRLRKADKRAYIGPEYQTVLDKIHAAEAVRG